MHWEQYNFFYINIQLEFIISIVLIHSHTLYFSNLIFTNFYLSLIFLSHTEHMVKQRYVITCDLGVRNPNEVAFKAYWKTKVHHRIQTFIWKLLNIGLMTNAERLRRGLVATDLCLMCKAASETTLHILRDYHQSSQLWNQLLHGSIAPYFFIIDL